MTPISYIAMTQTTAEHATVVAATSAATTMSLTNHGTSDAATVAVTDTLPTRIPFVSATGIGWTCTNAGNVSVSCTRPALDREERGVGEEGIDRWASLVANLMKYAERASASVGITAAMRICFIRTYG